MSSPLSPFEQTTGPFVQATLTLPGILHHAYNSLAAEPLSERELGNEAQRLYDLARQAYDRDGAMTPANMGIDDYERYIDLYSLQKIIEGEEREANTLNDWGDYQSLFERHGRPLEGGNALLVGAVGALSARSFTAMAQNLYGAGRQFVLDVKGGRNKTSHGTFVYGDALAMPFANGSIDLFETNQLMYKLEGPGDWRGKATQFIQEMGRVAAPGAQVLLREVDPGSDLQTQELIDATSPFGCFLTKTFQEAGFSIESLETAKTPLDSYYIFDRNQEMAGVTPLLTAATLSLFARRDG